MRLYRAAANHLSLTKMDSERLDSGAIYQDKIEKVYLAMTMGTQAVYA